MNKESKLKTKVSIIMGIYNCESTLPKAIESILEQTYTNWELIMCDDASEDRTFEVASEYSKRFPCKIKLIRNEVNRKLAYSLNRCLEVAEGEYIARMDADDISLPFRIEKETEFLDNHSEYDLVSCRTLVFDESGDRGIRNYSGEHYKEELIQGVPFLHPTIMVRKITLDQLGGYTVAKRTERGQDVDLYYKFFAGKHRGYTLDDVLYKYHESMGDYKKRNLKMALGITKTCLYGHKLVHFPLKYRIYAFRPILSAMMPAKLKFLRRTLIESKELSESHND